MGSIFKRKINAPRTSVHKIKGWIIRIPNDMDSRLIIEQQLSVVITADVVSKQIAITDEVNCGATYIIPLDPIASRLKEVL